MMMKSTDLKDLQRLLSHINDSYAGDYAALSRDLDKAIYCLHYLKAGEVPQAEVEDLCFALHRLSECFYRAHGRQRIRHHHRLVRLLDILKAS